MSDESGPPVEPRPLPPDTPGLTPDQLTFYAALFDHVVTDLQELLQASQKLQRHIRGLRRTASGLCEVLGTTPSEDIAPWLYHPAPPPERLQGERPARQKR